MITRFLFLLALICSGSVFSISAQIFFENEDTKPARIGTSQSGQSPNNQPNYPQDDNEEQQFQASQENQDNAEDYYDEIANGHRIRDPEKYRRQLGCLCNHQLKDPHCGTDFKLYDNGCYFECAQKRNPRLNLRNWGPCL